MLFVIDFSLDIYTLKKIIKYSNFETTRSIACASIKCNEIVKMTSMLTRQQKNIVNQIINSEQAEKLFLSQWERRCNLQMCLDCSKLYTESAFSWW